MTRTKTELLIAIVAVALGTVGFLFHWAPAEVLGLLFACVALGMVLFRALPADDSTSSTRP
jgi:NAD kinase